MIRTCVFALMALLAFPVLAAGQDCTIAAYLDPAGTISQGHLDYNWSRGAFEFSVYVVLFAEDTAAAAAYSMQFEQTIDGPFLESRVMGPSGNGLTIDERTGTNVAFTECAIGFGGVPVLVDEYRFVAFDPWVPIWQARWPGATFSLGPNTSQDPDSPQYVTCNDIKKDCDIGPDLAVINGAVSTGSQSFSAVKSLYLGN